MKSHNSETKRISDSLVVSKHKVKGLYKLVSENAAGKTVEIVLSDINIKRIHDFVTNL